MHAVQRLVPGMVAAFCLLASARAQIEPNVFPSPDAPASKRPMPPPRARTPAKLDASGNVPLIPRAILFGNAEKSDARLSPDGKLIAFLAPVNNVMNVWVGPVSDIAKAKPVTKDDRRGIRSFNWAYTNDDILYRQDKGGDENWRIFDVQLSTGAVKDLTPMEKVQARIVEVSEKFPDQIVLGVNNRDPRFHDLYTVNIRSGAMKELERNEIKDESGKSSGYGDFVVDDDYHVRLASKINTDGSVSMFKATQGAQPGFELFFTIPMQDAQSTRPVGFNKDASKLYLLDSRGRDLTGLYELDLKTGKTQAVYEDDYADVGNVLINPVTKQVDMVQTEYDRKFPYVMTPNFQPDLLAFRSNAGNGDMEVTSRSQDDSTWLMTLSYDDGPQETWLIKRGNLKDKNRKAEAVKLFVTRPALSDKQLAPMNPVIIKSRDGVDLVSYLTLPLSADPNKTGSPSKPLPMVLLVHGGPWARDSWGYNGSHQWLANRGYAVLSVNFRASTGLGKKFLNAGNLEWAGKMHNDLLDAVNWAVSKKIADPKKIAIMGGSYGGYATLVGLTFTPDVFACGVDIVGPSNLVTLLNSIPAYWGPELDLMTKQVGDHRTAEGRKFLESRSPISRVDKISKPLLIGQGANDPRVNQAESDQIVKAMQGKSIPVTYVLYPDEGHGFARPENRTSFYAVAEGFLATHLGGRAEPIGADFANSSITVPVGADKVPGLADALNGQKATEAARPAAPATKN